jgi:hypothetical protein
MTIWRIDRKWLRQPSQSGVHNKNPGISAGDLRFLMIV